MSVVKLKEDKKLFLEQASLLKSKGNAKIILGITDLSFHRATGAVVAYVLEKMGFEVERRYALHEENFKRLKNEEINMISSAWIPSSHGVYKEEVEKTLPLLELGLHYEPYALWGVPDYVPSDEVSEISDLLKPNVLSKMRKVIQGIGMGAGITRFSIKMMDEYLLNNAKYEFKTGTQEECIKAFEDGVASKEWFIVPLWQPQFLHHTYNIRELKEPKGLLGIVDRAILLCDKNKIESLLSTEQINILDNIVLSNKIVSSLDYMVCKEGLSEDEAVEKWFKN